MATVPNFALYGTDARSAWIDAVHFERIHERSGAHDYEIEPHFHDALVQVFQVHRGHGEAVFDGVPRPLRAPCLIVVPAGIVHSFSFSSDIDGPVVTAAQRALEAVAAAATPDLLRCIRRAAVMPLADAVRHAEALVPLFDAIEHEAQVGSGGQGAAGLLLLAALFVQIARIGDSLGVADGVEGPARSRKGLQVERFRALVDARFRERRPIGSYAGELGLSAGQLTRLCRERLGMSSLDVVNARVAQEAQRELVYSSLGIKQIAAQLGFADEAYFSRFFRKQTGQRPTVFRETARRRLAAPR